MNFFPLEKRLKEVVLLNNNHKEKNNEKMPIKASKIVIRNDEVLNIRKSLNIVPKDENLFMSIH